MEKIIDTNFLKEQYEKTKSLLENEKVLREKMTEIDKKVQEYRNQLLKEVENLNKKVKREFKATFDEYPGFLNDLYVENNFYTEIKNLRFSDNIFDHFVNVLGKNYQTEFETICLRSKRTKDFEEWESAGSHYDELVSVKKNLVACLIVPKSMSEIIKYKYKYFCEKNIDTLCKEENIFLISKNWGKVDKKYEIYHNTIKLSDVFSHLYECEGTVESLKKCDIDKNVYYKNDKRFEDAIFETLEFLKKEMIEKEKMQKKQEIKDMKKYIEKMQKEYDDMCEM